MPQHVRRPTHDYEPTREAAMAAFAKSWRREWARPAIGEAGAFKQKPAARSISGAEGYRT
jgi:hypothetical protein